MSPLRERRIAAGLTPTQPAAKNAELPDAAEIARLVALYDARGPNGEPSAAERDFHRGDFRDYSGRGET